MFNVEYKKFGGIAIAIVRSKQIIDTGDVTQFGDEIINLLEKRPDSHLLLNFEKVDFMSGAMLTEMLRINDVVRTQRGSLRVFGLRKEMKQVFEVTKLDSIFRIENDCGSAPSGIAKRWQKTSPHRYAVSGKRCGLRLVGRARARPQSPISVSLAGKR